MLLLREAVAYSRRGCKCLPNLGHELNRQLPQEGVACGLEDVVEAEVVRRVADRKA
jgi:hypothetical protein